MFREQAPFWTGFAGMLAIGWFVFPSVLYRAEEQPLQFSHAVHTSGAGMACEDCHTFAVDGRFEGIPRVATCAGCHAEQIGETEHEKRMVEQFIRTGAEISWRAYSRQPDNVYFSHIAHVRVGNIECAQCHGSHRSSDSLRTYYENRISGYSRDIWGEHISGVGPDSSDGMKMDQCSSCHHERSIEESCLRCHK